jgi:regulator of protease activity HflC (stomatin/prohibitin superfamily)
MEPDASSSSLLLAMERTKQAQAEAAKAQAEAAKAQAEAAKAQADTRYLELLREVFGNATPQEVIQLTSRHPIAPLRNPSQEASG